MRTTFAIVVAFVLLAGAVPVQAQIFAGQYGPADQLLRSNLDMVDRWMWYGNMYGYTRGGNFYGMYDRNGRRLSRPVKIAIAGAELGATIGYAKGGGKGALIGAGLGAAPGLIAWALSKGGNDDEMMVQLPDQIPPMPTGGPQTTSGRENGWNDVLRRQQGALAGPAANPGSGEFTLVNATRFPVDVYDGTCEEGCYKGRMRPDEERQVSAPSIGYKGYALIPNSRGGLSKDRTDFHPSDDGWVFIEPSFGSGR